MHCRAIIIFPTNDVANGYKASVFKFKVIHMTYDIQNYLRYAVDVKVIVIMIIYTYIYVCKKAQFENLPRFFETIVSGSTFTSKMAP